MSGIGKILKSEREKKALTIEDVAKKTHISERILLALEKGEFQEIPGKFYVINFLKSYLRAIDLDEGEFFHTHQSIIKQITSGSENDPRQYYSKLRYTRFKRRNLILIILAVLVICALAYFIFFRGTDLAAQLFKTHKSLAQIPPTGMALDLRPRNWSQDMIPVHVEITFVADCWMQVFRGNRKIIEQVFKTGERQYINGYQVKLLIGNPSAVDLKINNRVITKYKHQTRPLRLALDPESASELE